MDALEKYRTVFLQLFDCSAAHVVLLDLEGTIIETNTAWRQFGTDNGLAAEYEFRGVNYLSLIERAAEQGWPGAKETYLGLLEVMHARRPKFTTIYPCHSPTERCWYRMWLEPQTPQVPAIIVAHYLCATKPLSAEGSIIEPYVEPGDGSHSGVRGPTS